MPDEIESLRTKIRCLEGELADANDACADLSEQIQHLTTINQELTRNIDDIVRIARNQGCYL